MVNMASTSLYVSMAIEAAATLQVIEDLSDHTEIGPLAAEQELRKVCRGAQGVMIVSSDVAYPPATYQVTNQSMELTETKCNAWT